MLNLKPVIAVQGILLTALGVAMLVPLATDLLQGNPDWQAFAFAAAACLFAGGMAILATRGTHERLGAREGFLITVSAWIVLPAFGGLPFMISTLSLPFADAFFEAMSGLTTTGSTVVTGLDTMAPGLLVWRALLQWLGGVGIIVMAVAILPALQIGGMQLFRLESSENSEKALPRIATIAAGTALAYGLASLLCMIALWAAGMSLFEAWIHAMTTLSTGGFSTSDGSIGHFDSAPVEWVVTFFMVIGGMPFLLLFQALRGRPLLVWRDSQVRLYLALLVVVSVLTGLWLAAQKNLPLADALRLSSFNVVSAITGTGFASDDYTRWGNFATGLFFFLMFIGGCAGSASCGIKIFRIQILVQAVRMQVGRLLQPHAVFVLRYNDKPMPETTLDAVMSFFFMYAFLFGLLSLSLAALGLDEVTALSAVATTLSNVGPGLGDVVGPSSTFQSLPAAAKWILSLAMLLGRLEIFTVLALLSPRFWRD